MNGLGDISKILYNKALKEIEEKNITKALDFLKNAYLVDNSDIDIINLLGLCNYMKCDFSKANFYWHKSYSKSKEDNRAETYLMILNSEDIEVMIENYNKALEALENNDLNLALKNLKKVIRYDNKFIEPYIIMGLIYLKKKLYYSSKKSFKKAISLDRGNAKVNEYYIIASERAMKEKLKNI